MPDETLTTPDGTPVDVDWQRQGAATGFDPPPPERLRIAAFGRPGHGKTEFLMQIPGALVLDYDNAANMVQRQVATRIPMTGHGTKPVWELHDEIMKKLEYDAQSRRRYRVVCLDTIDRWFDANGRREVTAWNAHERRQKAPAMRANSLLSIKDEGASWGRARDSLLLDLERLTTAGYGWIVTGHVQLDVQKIGQETVHRWVPTLNRKIAAYVFGQCEYVLDFDRRLCRRTEKRTINGVEKEITLPGEALQYSITLAPRDDAVDCKMRIALKDKRLVFNQYEGWTTLSTAYLAAIAAATKPEPEGESECQK